jgi:hypothetical protein
MANTVVYQEEWAAKLQERLGSPQNWKEVCRVEYIKGRVFNNPYMSTTPASAAHTRGTAFSHADWAVTNEYVTINQSRVHATYIDFADLAQQTFVRQMEMAELAADILNEYVETDMLANHAMWTNFDNASIGGDAGNITVSVTNIADIITGMKREIREANGMKLAKRNGMFIIWRPADFEILEQYAQANGFNTADNALLNGTLEGFKYMGVEHYVSNSHDSGHLFGGVKGLFHVGICKDTYGKVYITMVPAQKEGGSNEAGPMSGISVHQRLDWEFKAWANTVPVLYDILVA